MTIADSGRADEVHPHDEIAMASRWCAEELSEEQLEFLTLQAETLAIDLDGLGPSLFCHGSPRSGRDRITVATPAEKVLPMLAGVSERVIVCGHTPCSIVSSVITESSTPAV